MTRLDRSVRVWQPTVRGGLVRRGRIVGLPSPFPEDPSGDGPCEDFEKEYLNWVLQIAEGNVSKAAGMAGKYRADFYSLLKKYDLKPEDFKKT